MQGKYERIEEAISTRGYPEADRKAREYWMEQGKKISNSSTRGPNDFFGFLILGVDEEGEKKIREATINYANTLFAIATERKALSDRVKAMTFQLFDPSRG